jgi:hypothetical protein
MAGGGYGNGEKRQQRKISAESGQRVRFGHGFQRLLRIDNKIEALVFPFLSVKSVSSSLYH